MPTVNKETHAATKGVSVTKSDSTVLPVTRGLHVHTAGNVAVTWADGGNSVLTCVAGAFYPYAVTKVLDTGTTATVEAIY